MAKKTSFHVYVETATGTRKVFSGTEVEAQEFATVCRTTQRRKSTLSVMVRCGYSRRPVFEMGQSMLDGETRQKRTTVCPKILKIGSR